MDASTKASRGGIVLLKIVILLNGLYSGTPADALASPFPLQPARPNHSVHQVSNPSPSKQYALLPSEANLCPLQRHHRGIPWRPCQ